MSNYPEHDKLAAVQDKSQCVGEFLEWLQSEGIDLARLDENSARWVPIHDSIKHLLAKFFDVDLVKLEAEKRSMLAFY